MVGAFIVLNKTNMKITIDTCLINAKEKLFEMNQIEDLHKRGIIEIVGTERLLRETENHGDRKKKAKNYDNISEPMVIGQWRVGSGYISSGKGPSFKDISNILFPEKDFLQLTENESSDVMHLLSHAESDSRYFLTNNSKDFINAKRNNENRNGSYLNFKRDQLKKLGIQVITPEEFLSFIDNKNPLNI